MTPHWTEHYGDLRQWLAAKPRILIGSDFDGTLAPIVDHASDAHLPAATLSALLRLAAQPGIILAVITGRSLDDVCRRVPVPGAWYAGNHGLEMLPGGGGSPVLAPGAVEGRGRLRSVLGELVRVLAGIRGAWVEDKQFTASVHYRQASPAQHDLIADLVKSEVQGVPGIELRAGKCLWEIRPAIAWNKGSALMRFLELAALTGHAAAFLGDDVTDHDAFNAIGDGWSFFIGDASSPAKLRVHDTADAAHLLDWMARNRPPAPT